MGLESALEKVKRLGQKVSLGMKPQLWTLRPPVVFIFVQLRNHPTETFHQELPDRSRQLAVFVRESIWPSKSKSHNRN